MTARSNFIKKDGFMLLLMLLSFGIAAYFYPLLPDKVPSHWNIYGEVDGYSSKFFGAFGLPLLNLGLYIMLLVTPYLDPKKANYKLFEGAYQTQRMLLHTFFIGLQIVVLLSALGYDMNVAVIVKIGVSVLFISIGNLMGRFRYNYFVGVKTPWTLANEEVWRKTHRMAAPIWVIGGVICLLSSFWNNAISAAFFFLAMVVMSLVPTGYSYFEYRKQMNSKQ